MFIFVSAVFCFPLAPPTSVELSAAATSGCIPPAAFGTCEGRSGTLRSPATQQLSLSCSASLLPSASPPLPFLPCYLVIFLLPSPFLFLPTSIRLLLPSFLLAINGCFGIKHSVSIATLLHHQPTQGEASCALFPSASLHISMTPSCVYRLHLPSSQAQ